MSIIGGALAGGLTDGMRIYAGQMAQRDQQESRQAELAQKLKAEREELLMKLAATAHEGNLNRVNAKEVAEAKNVSQFERRPDLYGADAKPVDRAKFEKDETSYSRTDDSEHSDAVSRKAAPLIESVKRTYDEAGHKKAEDERVQRNIDRKTQVDEPAHFDAQQKGRGRSIVVRELEKDSASAKATAASLTVEGKPRYSNSQGGNIVLDNATGDATTTDVGESVITKNERAPAPKGGGGGGAGGADARALVNSLRTQSTNISKNIAKLSEGYITPQKQAMINEAKTELKTINGRLADAEQSLSRTKTSQGDNAVAAPASKADYDKLPRGAKYKAPDGSIRTKG